jgi:predicted permease
MYLRWFALLFAVILAMACGTLEVGIERAATPTRALATRASSPSAQPSSTTTRAPTAAPTPVATATLILPATRERITFGAGSTDYAFAVNLTSGMPQAYVLTILAQQHMDVTANGAVTIIVLDRQNKPVVPTSLQPGQWAGVIPQTGDYTIVLQGAGVFNVSINIPPLGG